MDAFDSVGNEDNGGIFPRELSISSPFVAINHINRTLQKREARRFARTHTLEDQQRVAQWEQTRVCGHILTSSIAFFLFFIEQGSQARDSEHGHGRSEKNQVKVVALLEEKRPTNQEAVMKWDVCQQRKAVADV